MAMRSPFEGLMQAAPKILSRSNELAKPVGYEEASNDNMDIALQLADQVDAMVNEWRGKRMPPAVRQRYNDLRQQMNSAYSAWHSLANAAGTEEAGRQDLEQGSREAGTIRESLRGMPPTPPAGTSQPSQGGVASELRNYRRNVR